jgi:hypothetical protein
LASAVGKADDLRIVTYTAAPGTSGTDPLDLLRASRLSEAR